MVPISIMISIMIININTNNKNDTGNKNDTDINADIDADKKNENNIVPEKNESETGSQRIRPTFEDDLVFGRQTSYVNSAVHIPTDIYEGSTIVLNELNWTGALDDVFKRNRNDDPTLLWQVFGSATGLARYYPASPWVDKSRTPNKIDLYDVRRRPWYIQGAASPKDMLILVDASGSVSGLTLKLIRTSVIEMLETLSDDDFVNVVSFNDHAQNVSCFNHLVQANVRNKKKLKEAVYKISAHGVTNYKNGFSYAFEQLLNDSHSVYRANCNKIIMLFTDGGEERAQEIFHKYNKEKKVRVFTFSVGQHNYDKGPIQWMACQNKGILCVFEYLDVLGRPMVLAGQKAKQVQWTNVYLDALELGLVISGTLPVFNLTQNGTKNQLILGVMGVDVSLEEIKKLTPRFTLCPNGYYFAIDPNGYVLLHPNLQPKHIGLGIPKVNLKKRRPHVQNPKSQEPVTLDFLDADLENNIKVEAMTFLFINIVFQRYIDKGNRTYTWTAVNGTDYSLALVLPSYSFYYIKATIEEPIIQARFSESLKLDHFEEVGYTLIAPREYCNDVKITDNNTEFLLNFNEFIDRNTPNNTSCNADMVIRVLLDAGLTNELVQRYWSKSNPNGVLARFVVTDGGITRVYPKSAGEDWMENPETYEISFYKRSLDNDKYIFTAPYYNSKSLQEVFKACTVNPLRHGGSQSRLYYIRMCCLNRSYDITFFGEIDPGLMRNFINMSLYAFNKSYDYQSVCDPEEEPKQGAGLRSAYVPTIADILHLGWWASAALFLSLTFPHYLEADEDDFTAALSKQSCITEQTQYFFENDEKTFSGILDCGNCSRLFHAEKVSNTNLVFIISDTQRECPSCDPKPLMQAEKSDEGPNPCEMVQQPRYRKGPDVCFDEHENEDSSDCGGASGLSPSLWSMVGIQLVLLWLLSGSRHCQL
uniref:VWFA domain-containing protein n=1 Tax=Sphenodon punctatus TaxID=8508 RepID=A0A8D0G9G3_SPHPU